MSDYSELKTAATRVVEVQASQDVPISKLFDEFDALASPEAVLALIADNERYLKLVERMVDQYVPLTELEGVPGWSRVVELVEVVAERDRLKTEVEGLRAQHCRDSAELRSLSQARDDARKERDQLKAEVEALRSQVATLQSDANSWQSGYDEGRRMGTKTALDEREHLRREIAALKPSPIRTDKTTIGYTGCVICGQYTDHGGLQCPNLAFRSLSMEPPTKPVRPAPILMSVHGYPVDEDGKYIERKEVKP